MNESIRKYMKVGLVHFMAYPNTINGEGPIIETLKKIARDDYFEVGFPGSENDVEELVAYLRVLLSIGFLNKENRPIVSLEVKPVGDDDPDLIIANAKRVLNLAWDKV